MKQTIGYVLQSADNTGYKVKWMKWVCLHLQAPTWLYFLHYLLGMQIAGWP